MFEVISFYFFAIVTLGAFWITVMSKSALYSMTALAMGMIMISGFFFLLNADFLGVVQIIVYTGAVMAIYAFGMMFFDTIKEVKEKNPSNILIFVLGGLSALLVVIIFAAPMYSEHINALYPMVTQTLGEGDQAIEQVVLNSESVGVVLFTKYLIPFEVAAVMLLVAMIAGIVLAGKKMDESLTLMSDAEIEERGF
ncbi:MAG: NADH:ubiquinone oxidoreductase subunit J [Sulfuricurvum sp. PC08-66]|nr:MAG: NADH:ubiquinone oxidoreductase subunit J [Sulfuricurvum sp. PC08-66]